MKKSYITILIIILVVVFSWYLWTKNGVNPDKQVAKCIASKSILYIQTGCVACEKQKQIFGDSYNLLNKVDCVKDTTRCIIENITAIPTWDINGEKYKSVKTIEELKNMTGC